MLSMLYLIYIIYIYMKYIYISMWKERIVDKDKMSKRRKQISFLFIWPFD